MQRIYLDACALNRLLDDTSQPRVRAESQAIERFFALLLENRVAWIASAILREELRRNPHDSARLDALEILEYASENIDPNRATILRAEHLEELGYGAFDALHLACAEQAGADSLLTTDDRFLRRARRASGNPQVKVENPLHWLREFKP